MDALKTFLSYKRLGYKIIPLYENSKIPMFNKWQENYSYDKIENIIKTTSQKINFGIVLGDIIDLEGDCVSSNKLLDEILKNINHPTFISNKSRHHLFRSNIKNLTKVVFNGIEARGYRHQSVIPPSLHITGCRYEWETDVIPYSQIPELPSFLETKIISLIPSFTKKINKNNLKPNHSKVLCCKCNEFAMLNNKRLEKEIHIFNMNNFKWMCIKCRPFDLRKLIKCSNKNQSIFS
jgi:hypothetical protein